MATPSPSTIQQLRRGLIGVWPLGDATAATRRVGLWTPSASPAELDLADNASVALGTGPSANLPAAAEFAAASSRFLSHADNRFFSLGASAKHWTILIWAMPSQVASAGQVIAKDLSGGREFNINMSTTPRWILEVFDGTNLLRQVVYTAVVPATNVWAMLCARWDPNSRIPSMNVNAGVPLLGAAAAGAMGDTATALQVGARAFVGSRQFWSGRMAHLVIWERLLSRTEEFTLWNSGQGIDLTRGV